MSDRSREQVRVDIFTRMLERRRDELMAEGMTKDDADEQAFREVRQQIRKSP